MVVLDPIDVPGSLAWIRVGFPRVRRGGNLSRTKVAVSADARRRRSRSAGRLHATSLPIKVHHNRGFDDSLEDMRPADLLAQIQLFQGLSDEDREVLAERLAEKRFAAGEVVFAQGDQGSSMYVVRSGAVQIYLPGAADGSPSVTLKDVRTGEYFGELAIFDDKPRSASVRAVVDTVLLELTREELAEHLARSKTATMTILAEMAGRLRETNAMLSQRATKDVVKEFEENLTWGQRLADRVAELNGSWEFILVLLGLTAGWCIVNIPAVAEHLGLYARGDDGKVTGFDPYPYILYNLVLAILVSLQGPLIVMSQNRESAKDRAQAETDFRVNLKNEVGIEKMLAELGALRAETSKRLDALERAMRADRVRSEVPAKMPGGPLGAA
jgi:CRP/FNR family cyclic AMP-dependent transcriptional regulator